MAWRRPGDKPLSEPMMVRLTTHICVTRPQWVKKWLCYSGHRVALVVHRAQKSVPDLAGEWPTFLPPPLERCSGTTNADGPNCDGGGNLCGVCWVDVHSRCSGARGWWLHSMRWHQPSKWIPMIGRWGTWHEMGLIRISSWKWLLHKCDIWFFQWCRWGQQWNRHEWDY